MLSWGYLGPVLFIIFVNDLSINLDGFTTMYADDTSLVSVHKNKIDLNVVSQSLLMDAVNWFEANGLFINKNKTQNLIVSLSSAKGLDQTDSVILLGISIDSSLSWKSHIDIVCRRLSRVIFLIVNLKQQVTYVYLRMAYFSFFESILRYGLLIWGNSVGLEKILVLQKKVVRIITNAKHLEHCRPLFVQSNILTVVNLYIFDVLMFVKNNLHKLTAAKMIHNYNTRNSENLRLPKCRLKKL